MLVTRKGIFVNFHGLMRYILAFCFLLLTGLINGQTVLTIEGKSYTNADASWSGVNISRSEPTRLTFRNNTITSVNTFGYMLQAGDEEPAATNNNLDDAVITGNRFSWSGTDMKSITHGLFTGHNLNTVIKYNYLDHVPMGIIRKSGNNMVNTGGGVAYNIVKSGAVGINIKGMSNVNVYNNTLYTDRTTAETWRGLIYIYTHTDITPNSVSHGTKIYNNIFYTKHQTYCIQIADKESTVGLESDYNIFYCESGTPLFFYCGEVKTFAQWQALGYDSHSKVINPNFKDLVNFVPSARLDFGKDLGPIWAEGLSVNAKWGTTNPETTMQNGAWQVGAVIHKEVVVTPPPAQIPAYSGAVISDASPSRIDITFSLALGNIVPTLSAFSILVNGASRGVTFVAVSGTMVSLTLASPFLYGDRVTLAYTKPATNPLQTTAGGQVASFTAQTVINNRLAPVNSPPLITISSPTKSSGFTAPANITVEASASDTDGTVTKVEFFNGTTKLGERVTAPWSFTWKDVREGSYSITATATDNSNARTTSEPVTVVVEKAAQAVNQIPSISITSPSMGGSFDLPASLEFTANASDPDGSVKKVEFYVGQILAGECLTSPYTLTMDFDAAGTYVITAKVFDNLNASAFSEPVSITLSLRTPNNDLLVVYPNPTDGAFTVDLTNLPEDPDPYTVSILSLSGRVEYSDLHRTSEGRCNLNISDAPGGIYIIMTALRGNVVSTKQFIKL